MKYVPIISNYFLAVLFMFTGIDKLLHYKGFIVALSSYVIVPNGAAEYLALPIIISEIWVACGLLIKQWRRMASLTGALALVVFTIALFVNYIYAPQAICGCWFSITLSTANIFHILLNLTLFGLAIVVWLDSRSMDRTLPSRLELSGIQLQSDTESRQGGVA
jgi:uncharacterized membrane protein